MSRWFRWYEGTIEDAKFRVVARMSRVTVRDALALWAFILEDAAHLSHRGVCQRDEDFMSATLDFDEGVVERILAAMQDVDMISVGPGAITVCNFNKRQFDSDTDPTASERQQRKRERDKLSGHTDVTRDSRRPDTETDTDTESKKESRAVADATRPDERFDEFWKVYPKRDGANPKAPARKKFLNAIKSGVDPGEIIAGAKRSAEEARSKGQIGTPYVPQAMTWLGQQRWGDYAPTNEPGEGEIRGFYASAASDELQAWDDFKRRTEGKTLPRDSKGGWLVPAQWPPEQETAH